MRARAVVAEDAEGHGRVVVVARVTVVEEEALEVRVVAVALVVVRAVCESQSVAL